MIKRLKYMPVLWVMLLLAACGASGTENTDHAAVAEDLNSLRFTCRLNGGEADIRFWGDGESTYYYFLPSGSRLDALAVGTRNGVTLRKEEEPEGSRVTFQNGETLSGIEGDTTYLLGCYDENEYLYEVPVRFMQGANVYSVFITTDGASMEPVLQDKEQKLKGDMLIADPEGNVVYQGRLTHIKGRGNGSWYSFKKPFNIKLSEKSDLLGMGASREWCLINQEMDASCMRNKLAYDLADDAGMAYSPDSEYADLWIDGDYFGLYLLTDRINISEASVDITSLEEQTEAVNMEALSSYPAAAFTEGSSPYPNSYSEIPHDPEDITGGYLFEVDKFYSEDKAARFHTPEIYGVGVKSPEYLSKNQFDYIYKLVLETEQALEDLDSARYLDYIDLDSWLNMCVYQEALANPDFMGSSQYFYKEEDSGGVLSKIYAGPVWDMDISMGCEGRNKLPVNVLMLRTQSWVHFLYERPECYEKITSLYRGTYRPLLQEMLDTKIDLLADRISASAAMNYTRWRAVAEKTGQADPFRDGVAQLKDYIQERARFLDDLWSGDSEYHTVLVTCDNQVFPYESYYYYRAYMVADRQPLKYLKEPGNSYVPEGYRFGGWYYGSPSHPGGPVDLNAPITADCKIHAEYVLGTDSR